MFGRFFLMLSFVIIAGCSEKSLKTVDHKSIDIDFVDVEIKSGDLGGTYLNAGKETPIVIMVPGSGPTDKDGNSGSFTSNTFKFLAYDLAAMGISTIRVDKRGMFTSGAAGNPNAVSVDIYAEDYRDWVKTALKTHDQSCVFLLGHSEGGLMVSAAAVDQNNVCGVILLAAPGRRLSDVIREQLKSNPANAIIMDEAMAALDALERGEKVDTEDMHPALLSLFNPNVQDYLISLFKVDPAKVLSQISAPKLVIQGTHDIQVSVGDAQRLARTSGAKLVVLEGISHILKPAPKERMANILTYNSPDIPVDARVGQSIANFVKDARAR